MNQKAAWAIIVVAVAAVGGYVSNLVQLVSLIGEPVTGEVLVRSIGLLVPPFGAFIGYF